MKIMKQIKLSATPKYKKFQLADVAGYKVEENINTRRCRIVGADNCIDNDFKNIDEVLKLVRRELMIKGFQIAS